MDAVRAEEELQRLRQELQAARAALEEFASAVAHDLRAPLRHILAYAELLREEAAGRLDGEAAQFLDTITQAAQLLARQIEGLRAWARLDQQALQPQAVDAAVLLAELQRALSAQAAGRALRWQIAPDLPRLQGDAALLRELFAQLLGNALKFTAPRALAEIRVGALAAEPGYATIEVADNGVGYDPARQERLFRVFQRLHSASRFEGLGLGLAMADKIVRRHGGRIAIEGAPDAGCRVRVTLPLAPG